VRGFLIGLAIALASSACGKKEAAPDAIGASSSSEQGRAIEFSFDSLDWRHVDAVALRGKPTVLVFAATWDLSSQAQIDFLVPMNKHDGDKINYVMVALQEKQDRELVEAFKGGLHVDFRVALADRDTIAGGGPFGDVHNVPTIVILDRTGKVAWKHVGLARSDELRAALKGL
jgi:hypothetical protein